MPTLETSVHSPDSTTHWACDEKINEGCCGCSGHECNKFKQLIGEIEGMVDEANSRPPWAGNDKHFYTRALQDVVNLIKEKYL